MDKIGKALLWLIATWIIGLSSIMTGLMLIITPITLFVMIVMVIRIEVLIERENKWKICPYCNKGLKRLREGFYCAICNDYFSEYYLKKKTEHNKEGKQNETKYIR